MALKKDIRDMFSTDEIAVMNFNADIATAIIEFCTSEGITLDNLAEAFSIPKETVVSMVEGDYDHGLGDLIFLLCEIGYEIKIVKTQRGV